MGDLILFLLDGKYCIHIGFANDFLTWNISLGFKVFFKSFILNILKNWRLTINILFITNIFGYDWVFSDNLMGFLVLLYNLLGCWIRQFQSLMRFIYGNTFKLSSLNQLPSEFIRHLELVLLLHRGVLAGLSCLRAYYSFHSFLL